MKMLSQIHCKVSCIILPIHQGCKNLFFFSAIKYRCLSISTEALLSLWSHEFPQGFEGKPIFVIYRALPIRGKVNSK